MRPGRPNRQLLTIAIAVLVAACSGSTHRRHAAGARRHSARPACARAPAPPRRPPAAVSGDRDAWLVVGRPARTGPARDPGKHRGGAHQAAARRPGRDLGSSRHRHPEAPEQPHRGSRRPARLRRAGAIDRGCVAAADGRARSDAGRRIGRRLDRRARRGHPGRAQRARAAPGSPSSSAPCGAEPRIVELPGVFDFDTLSPDGSILYVAEHVPGPLAGRYQVRAIDTATGMMRDAIIVDKRNVDEVMAGWPIDQEARADGVVLTLYRGAEYPFVHALQSAEAWAVCIDLPTRGMDDAGAAADWGVVTTPDGRSSLAVNATLGHHRRHRTGPDRPSDRGLRTVRAARHHAREVRPHRGRFGRSAGRRGPGRLGGVRRGRARDRPHRHGRPGGDGPLTRGPRGRRDRRSRRTVRRSTPWSARAAGSPRSTRTRARCSAGSSGDGYDRMVGVVPW